MVALLMVMHQLSFWLSLGLSYVTNLRLRMLYNCVAGLILGFYFHGVSYTFVIFQWASVYPLMAHLPRDSSWKPVMAITIICMTIRNMFMSLENGTIEFRVQATCIFMRQWMMCCHLLDSSRLDDKEKGKHMLEFEREQAEAVRKMPTFIEWCGYNLFPPSSWIGESVSYADWINFIRYQGKVTQMKIGSNFAPALRRLIEAELFLAVAVNVLKVASPFQLTDPAFADNSYWYQIVFVFLACQA